MYGLIQTGLGCTAAVVDSMDMREINDLMSYWTDSPPTHVATTHLRDVVISAFGGKPPSRAGARAAPMSADQFASMLGVDLGAP